MSDFKKFVITKMDNNTLVIESKDYYFAYTKADSILKDELKGEFEYVGGLQCNYKSDSEEYKILIEKLEKLARYIFEYENN